MQEAFKIVARVTGLLAFAMGDKKMKRGAMAIVVTELRRAADIIEGLINRA